MERQAGLGRSLEDVLELLTPADPEAGPNGRTIFEAEDLEQQLDQLMSDIRDLRERVQHLVSLVGDREVARSPVPQGNEQSKIKGAGESKGNKQKGKRKGKKGDKAKRGKHAKSADPRPSSEKQKKPRPGNNRPRGER
jgi:TolA-binding protein